MKNLILSPIIILLILVKSNDSLSQFFADASKTLITNEFHSSVGSPLGGSDINIGFEKDLKNRSSMSNEFMFSYFQNRHYVHELNHQEVSDRYAVVRNLGVSVRMFLNCNINRGIKPFRTVSFGAKGGVNLRGVNYLASYKEGSFFLKDERLWYSFGGIVRYKVQDLYVQMEISRDYFLGNGTSGWGVYPWEGLSSLKFGVGYQFGNR